MSQTFVLPAPAIASRPWSPAAAPAEIRDAAIDISVCIANWNCRDYLRACLDSLLDQPQGVSVEVIVTDNGSTDGAAEMVVDDYPEVVLIRNVDNRGFARASNQAAECATGRHILFLNNDTVVPAFTLARLVGYADSHPQIGMIGPRLRDGQGKLQISYRRKPTLRAMLHRASLLRWTGLFRGAYDAYRRDGFDPEGTRRVEVLMGAAMLVPRTVYEQCGGWDEGFLFGVEDVEFSDRVGRSRELVHVPGIEIIHFGRVQFAAERDLCRPQLDDRLRPLFAQERRLTASSLPHTSS